jgi:predicted ribosomally synthesized peptide with nif11-like leader
MSVQAALQFIQAVRQDENLQERMMLGHPASGEELVQVGRDAGFEYNEAELQAAYKHDWVMRSIRYKLTENKSARSLRFEEENNHVSTLNQTSNI